jgi:hypothetical protein
MKLLPALALLVLSLSLCNLFGNRNTANTNSNVTNFNTANSTANANNTSGNSVAMSDDDKHKLFQAAGMSRDSAIIMEVSKKIGIISPANTPTDYYQTFVNAHMEWARKNLAFMRDINTPEKAKEYVEKHR